MKSSEKIGEIMKKLLSLQNSFMVINKAASGQRNKYTSYDQLIAFCKPKFTEHEIVLLQPTGYVEGNFVVKTCLYHVGSDQWIASEYPVMMMDGKNKEGQFLVNKAQQSGGGISYAKRYALASLLAWATGDYDYDETNLSGENAHGGNCINEDQVKGVLLTIGKNILLDCSEIHFRFFRILGKRELNCN